MAEVGSRGQERELIRNWELELVSPPCLPGAEMWNAKAHLEVDISELIPYLNAALPGAKLQHTGAVLIWQEAGRKYAFRSREICSAPVKDNEEARRVIADIVQVVNDIWRRRGEIEPDVSRRDPPSVLAIYKLLPRTNCGECGRPTCMAYANELREGTAALPDCPLLCEPAREREHQQLIELLGEGI